MALKHSAGDLMNNTFIVDDENCAGTTHSLAWTSGWTDCPSRGGCRKEDMEQCSMAGRAIDTDYPMEGLHDAQNGGQTQPATGELSGEKGDRKSTRLNSSHGYISYAVFCLKKK